MTFQKDLLTVIVPTKERPDTLKHCLRTLVAQRDRRLQILVSDNVSSPETKAVVDSFSDDKRVKYVRPENRLGMSEHWDFALSHADGEWVTFIGDDDGLLPDAVSDFFALIKDKNVKAVNTCQVKYHWPSEGPHGKPSKLTVVLGTGVDTHNTKPWLKRVMHAKESFQSLPYIYTGGFVHADVINEIKQKSGGKFFCSITPDVYSGVAVSLTIDKYLYSWRPLAICGVSKHSNGMALHVGSIEGKADDFKKVPFFQESSIGFHPLLGDGTIHSIPMIVYESFLRAQHLQKEDMGIKLEDELGLFIVHAVRSRRQYVYDYCKKIAEQNGIDFTKIEQSLARIKVQARMSRISKNIIRAVFRTNESKRQIIYDPAIKNVYDAAVRSGEVLQKRKKAA